MNAAARLSEEVGKKPACEALGISRASFYRRNARQGVEDSAGASIVPHPPLALESMETQAVLDVLHSERFMDQSPYETYAALLDEDQYLCSIRTMYRILEKHGEVRERRDQVRRVHYQKPELLAMAPNQVWSWDITKLMGPAKWTYFYLYVIMDIFSRYAVGWMVAHRELAVLAERLISETCEKQGIGRHHLTIHADRGSSMKSKSVALLLSDLGVTKTHSRPHVSNDNPYSEAQFKTLKYRPEFPDRFGSIEDARAFCQRFFKWYNDKHHHSGIALLTPEQVHYGKASEILRRRSSTLRSAYEQHSNRFKGRIPVPMTLPCATWINKPLESSTDKIDSNLESPVSHFH
jgi:putative transposase